MPIYDACISGLLLLSKIKTSAVKRLITSKIKGFVYIIYACVRCIFMMLYNHTHMHVYIYIYIRNMLYI